MKPTNWRRSVLIGLVGSAAIVGAASSWFWWEDSQNRRILTDWYETTRWKWRAPSIAREFYAKGEPWILGAGPDEMGLVGLCGPDALEELGFECELSYVEATTDSRREELKYTTINYTSRPDDLNVGWDELTCTWPDGRKLRLAVHLGAAGCYCPAFEGAARFNQETVRLLVRDAGPRSASR